MTILDVRDILSRKPPRGLWQVLTTAGVLYTGEASIFSEEDGYITLLTTAGQETHIAVRHIVAMF